MAFSVSNTGSILEDFTNTLNEAFGGSGSSSSLGSAKGNPELFNQLNFGASAFNADRWTGNAYRQGSSKLKYGFAVVRPNKGGEINFNEDGSDVFFLQTAPQSIRQREIFGTNVQATRKGVIVESEGVVFKEIVITGNTGVFPGERGGSNTPSPNFSNFANPPSPPSGVDPNQGRSTRSGVETISGYEEFIRLRQFFLLYAREKVESKGTVFFSFVNQKDNEYFIVEPLDFTMERDSRSPLTYNYRIVLKAFAQLDSIIRVSDEDSPVSLFDQIGNISSNVTATIDSATEVINASVALLTSITQALDNTFLTPMRQLKTALDSISRGTRTVLSLPASLSGNAQNVSSLSLSVAESSDQFNTTNNNFATSQTATSAELTDSINTRSELTTNDQGEVTNTGPSTTSDASSTAQDASTINGRVPNILNNDGTLSEVLTPEQYTTIRDIVEQLENDPDIPIPRSFVEALKTNIINLSDDLADSIGAGDSTYNDIFGRVVTQPAPPLAVTTSDQLRTLGALRSIIRALNQVLSNNEFFEANAEDIYTNAQETYGQVSDINKPDSAREVVVELGDTLEKIALREYGDALRWVDLVIINKLKAPYISNQVEVPEGVVRPGDSILVGNI